MKRGTTAFICALIISMVSIFAFTSCDKDTDCKLKVHVVKKSDGRSMENVKVTISKNGATLKAEGLSDASGIFEATFHAPAIFDVVGVMNVTETVTDSINGTHEEVIGQYVGQTSVRLKDGEEVSTDLKMEYYNAK